MIICAFENSPSIPSFLVTKIVYIGYDQLKKWLLFLLPFHSCAPCRAHQTRQSERNSRPISAEVALPRLQSEIKVALFLFASHSFLANNLRFMVKLQGLKLAVAHSPFASKFQCGPLKIASPSSTWRVKIRKNKIV